MRDIPAGDFKGSAKDLGTHEFGHDGWRSPAWEGDRLRVCG